MSNSSPDAFKMTLIALSQTSNIDITDKNLVDQIIFTSYVGGLA